MTKKGDKLNIVVAEERYRSWITRIMEGYEPVGKEIYRARNVVSRTDFHGEEICIKSFKIPRFINSLIYTNLRKSKAKRSYENASQLKKLGFDTPRPIAYAEVKRHGRLRQSAYFCRFEHVDNMRDWELKPDCESLLRAFAREMIRLHTAGIFIKDFSPGNILYQKRDDGSYRFLYVDLNRMKFDIFDKSTLMRNFRCIHIDDSQTRRLARIYAEEAGLDPTELENEASRQLHKYLRHKQSLNRIKKLFGLKKNKK